jgi:UDP-glucose 4-epimerase
VLNAAENGAAPLQIFGNDYATADGTCIRDYVHVSDICGAHVLALDYMNNGGASQCFNIGNGSGYSVAEVVAASSRLIGHPIPAKHAARRAGDPAVLVASSDKVRREMGWQPKYHRLEAIIESAWNWHHDGARAVATRGSQ